MDLKPFLPETRPLFEGALRQSARPLSAYSFPIHILWRDHFSFFWTLYRDQFLLFAEYDRRLYMPLPPLGPFDPGVVEACFDRMDRQNQEKGISRIENIAESDLPFYHQHGLVTEPKAPEYLYKRAALADLKGERYKTHRWACNHFEGKYQPTDRPYALSDDAESLTLFQKWAKGRAARHADPVYQWMLHDSESVHRRALAEADRLGLIGRVIEVAGEIVGYTLGFPLSADTFCILAEVVDLELTGAAPYLFRAFCARLTDFTWINTMDDSGLENLQAAKTRYHPEQKVGCFLARRS